MKGSWLERHLKPLWFLDHIGKPEGEHPFPDPHGGGVEAASVSAPNCSVGRTSHLSVLKDPGPLCLQVSFVQLCVGGVQHSRVSHTWCAGDLRARASSPTLSMQLKTPVLGTGSRYQALHVELLLLMVAEKLRDASSVAYPLVGCLCSCKQP